MAMLAVGIGAAVGALIGGTVLVVGGTIAAIQKLANNHTEEMIRIINLREETIQRLKNQKEKDLHRHKEFQKVFQLFQLEVEQAKRLITEAEYKDENGKTIKGYDGEYTSISNLYFQLRNNKPLKSLSLDTL